MKPLRHPKLEQIIRRGSEREHFIEYIRGVSDTDSIQEQSNHYLAGQADEADPQESRSDLGIAESGDGKSES